jgi:hypothetical protein
LAQALTQIAGAADVEMTGYGNGFENVDVVHRWVTWFGPPSLRYGATLSPFGWVALIGVAESGACRAVARAQRRAKAGEGNRTLVSEPSIGEEATSRGETAQLGIILDYVVF